MQVSKLLGGRSISLRRALSPFLIASAVVMLQPGAASLAGPALAHGAKVGAYVVEPPGIESAEAGLGKSFDIEHFYRSIDDPIPDDAIRATYTAGRVALVNLFSTVRWSAVAAGQRDTQLQQDRLALQAFGQPIYVNFHHEPENDTDSSQGQIHLGDPADFAAAFAHVSTILRQAPNVKMVIILMGTTYDGTADQYWPGDPYVDVVGDDGYNWAFTPDHPNATWRSFQTVFQAGHDYAAAHLNKPFWATETGCAEDPNMPGRKAQWFTDAGTTIASWPTFMALVYFWGGANQDYFALNTSPSSRQAFSALMN
jgi:hypothetical protein